MSETWFIGDTHFGHEKIIEYEQTFRPFSCLEDMHEAMVERWNAVVRKHDIVWHLGDFAFGKDNVAIAGRLAGQKRLILGNHDTYPMAEYLKYFNKVYGAYYWERYLLTHVPVHPANLNGRADYNIHGHLHHVNVMLFDKKRQKGDEWVVDKRYVNVSVEQINLTPINAQEIFAREEKDN